MAARGAELPEDVFASDPFEHAVTGAARIGENALLGGAHGDGGRRWRGAAGSQSGTGSPAVQRRRQCRPDADE